MKAPAPEEADPTRLLKADGTLAGAPDEPPDATALLTADGRLSGAARTPRDTTRPLRPEVTPVGAAAAPREPTRLLTPEGRLAAAAAAAALDPPDSTRLLRADGTLVAKAEAQRETTRPLAPARQPPVEPPEATRFLKADGSLAAPTEAPREPTRPLATEGTLDAVVADPPEPTRFLTADGTLAAKAEEPRETTRLLTPDGRLGALDDERIDSTEKHVRVEVPAPEVGGDATKIRTVAIVAVPTPEEPVDQTARHFRVEGGASTDDATRVIAVIPAEVPVPVLDPAQPRGPALARAMRGLVIPLILVVAATANWWLTMKVERTCQCGTVTRNAAPGYRWMRPNCAKVCGATPGVVRGTAPRPTTRGTPR